MGGCAAREDLGGGCTCLTCAKFGQYSSLKEYGKAEG